MSAPREAMLSPPSSQNNTTPIAVSVESLQRVDVALRAFLRDSHHHPDDGLQARLLLKTQLQKWSLALDQYQPENFQESYPPLDNYYLTLVFSNPLFSIPLRYSAELSYNAPATAWLEVVQATLQHTFCSRPFRTLKFTDNSGADIDIIDLFFRITYRLTRDAGRKPNSINLGRDQLEIVISLLLACTTYCGIQGLRRQIDSTHALANPRSDFQILAVPDEAEIEQLQLPPPIHDALCAFVHMYRSGAQSSNLLGGVGMYRAQQLYRHVRQVADQCEDPKIFRLLEDIPIPRRRANRTQAALQILAQILGTNSRTNIASEESHDMVDVYFNQLDKFTLAGRIVERIQTRTKLPSSFLLFLAIPQPDWRVTLSTLGPELAVRIALYIQNIPQFRAGVQTLQKNVFDKMLEGQEIPLLPFYHLPLDPQPQTLESLFTDSTSQ